jgi:hypothetical protein
MSPPIATSRISPSSIGRGRISAGKCRPLLNHPAVRSEPHPVSRNLISRRAGVLAAVVAAGVVGMACPAMADVTISPPSAPQGSGQNVHLDVKNTAATAITKVKLVLPRDTPVAEVFPLSVDNWAPQIENMTLDEPLTSIHGGTPVTETAASITWIAVGAPLPPGRSADLAVALGPLPTTGQMTFTVIPTYADGKVGPAMPPATLTLTPAEPGGQAPGHTGHDGTGAPGTSSDDAAFAAVVAQAEQGPGFWSIAGWVVAALAVSGAVVALLRGRRRSGGDAGDAGDAPDEDGDGAEKETVTAGARVTNWSYRDGPG